LNEFNCAVKKIEPSSSACCDRSARLAPSLPKTRGTTEPIENWKPSDRAPNGLNVWNGLNAQGPFSYS